MVRARAELSARDQTLQLNADMAQQSQAAAGVTHYVWSTSQDSSVREDVKGRGDPDHAHLDGLTFSWDEPPVTCERTGDRNHPGQDFQCRCVAVPVLEEYDTPQDVDDS
jgi:SPP1 gp7 family putative phage head morphogenesis protein